MGTLRRLVASPNGFSPQFCSCGLLMTQLSPLSLSWGRPQQGQGLIGDGVWLELDLMAVTVAWMSRLDNRLPGDSINLQFQTCKLNTRSQKGLSGSLHSLRVVCVGNEEMTALFALGGLHKPIRCRVLT